ncbi:MAG: hypothetical protein M3419_06270 [Actinomycetota bacterium]|nr:hypothetical protein [Actinomycetota bacterium]
MRNSLLHQLNVRGRAFAAVGGLLAAPLLWGAAVAPAPAAGGFCSMDGQPGLVTNRWIGSGGGLWVDDANWSTGSAPNMLDGDTAYACINAGGTVRMREGESANMQAIDVAAGTTLQLDTGSMLYVEGDQSTRPSTVRRGATVNLLGTLGGPGRINLAGHLTWTSTRFGASTITTRKCALFATNDPDVCDSAVSGPPGLLSVRDTGTLRIPGRGVNLFDEYQLEVRGAVRLAGAEAYVAADRGTAVELRPQLDGTGVGRLVIANDGGWYEGRTRNGLNDLSTFVNEGLLLKRGTSGTSVIAASYERVGGGAVRVVTGTLALPAKTDQPVDVSPESTYGSGRCGDGAGAGYGCQPVTFARDKQLASLQVPAQDADGATVTLDELAPSTATTLGVPLRVHAEGLVASRVAPARLLMRYDATILAERTWEDLNVLRRADGTRAYRLVLACLGDGRPPLGSVACVDRRGLTGSSRTLNGGDVVMVIRTTATSRWVAR